jgi:hypothetical protein
MAQFEVEAPDNSSRVKSEKRLPPIGTENDESLGLDNTGEEKPTSAHDETWGKSDLAAWGKPKDNSPVPGDTEFSIVSGRTTLEDTKRAAEALNNFALLAELQEQFAWTDSDKNGKLSRAELRKQIDLGFVAGQEPKRMALKDFPQLSGGTNEISPSDLERQIKIALTTAIEVAGKSGKLGAEERSAIARWTQMPKNSAEAQVAQDKLNNALEGSGIQAKIELSTFKNYLGEEIPISTVSMMRDNKEVDRFAYSKNKDADSSLIGGKKVSNLKVFDNADPNKTFSPEMTKDLRDLRDLHVLMQSIDMSDGQITFDEAASSPKLDGLGDHAHAHLQDEFARMAMMDGDGKQVSRRDLQNAMIEKLTAVMKNSILRDGLKSSDLVDQMVATSIRDDILGHSQKLEETLNAALEKHGYRASLSSRTSDPYDWNSLINRRLSIYDVNDRTKHNDVDIETEPALKDQRSYYEKGRFDRQRFDRDQLEMHNFKRHRYDKRRSGP